MKLCFPRVFALIFTSCVLVCGYSAQAIPTVSAVPSVGSANVGDGIQVDILIADVVGLTAYDLSIGYDPSILRATGVQQGEFLSLGGFALWLGETGGPTPGAVSHVVELLLSVPEGVSGDGRLFSIRFDVIGAGLTPIDFLPPSLLSDGAANSIPVMTDGARFEGIGNGDIVVPEPATLALIGLGMGLAGLGARKRKRARG